jgi:hypothetical protein
MKHVFLTILAGLTLAGSAQATEWKTYRDDGVGYSITGTAWKPMTLNRPTSGVLCLG